MDSLEMDAQELDVLESKLERLVIEHYSKIKEENKKLKEDYNKLKIENERLKRVISMHSAHMGLCVRHSGGEWEDLE